MCSWSRLHQERRSSESAARACVNGQVKIFVRGLVLNGFEDKDLKRILLEGCRWFVNAGVESIDQIQDHPLMEQFIIKMSPTILKYLRAKVKSFAKHIIAPNFSCYDLRLKFSEDFLKVDIEGYVWANQFCEVNRLIAADPEVKLLPDVLDNVLQHQEMLPTVTLNWKYLADNYQIEEVRAKAIIKIVQQCQIDETFFPPSLLDIWTPSSWSASEGEQRLRARAFQLIQGRPTEEEIEESIMTVTSILAQEGLYEELLSESMDRDILVSMRHKLMEMYPEEPQVLINGLMLYHTLLLRTGSSNQWTFKRRREETEVVPYHPLIIGALQQRVEVRIAMTAEHLRAEENNYVGQLQDGLYANFAWTQVSILRFLHEVSLSDYQEPVSQTTVSLVSCQDQGRSFKEANEGDEECDDIFFNSKNEGYIIINGDLRKLYALRPVAVEGMPYAFFATRYYRKRPEQRSIVDPQSNVGGESGEPLPGGASMAPLFLRLSNTIIMKKRSDGSHLVPLLRPSHCLDIYGERLLFKPWRSTEELIHDSSEEERAQLRLNRLNLFPLSVFPSA